MVDVKKVAVPGMTDLAAKIQANEAAKTAAADAVEKLFIQYHSARAETRLMTKTGVNVAFVQHKFITDNQEIIDYLDAEIEAGLNVIFKGEAMSSAEADPMAGLKKRMYDEAMADILEVAGETPVIQSPVSSGIVTTGGTAA